MFAEAEERLREAVKRATANHTKARDGAPQYYRGVALRALGRDAEAAAAFGWASWDAAFAGPSWYALAELACRRGDSGDALEALTRALAANALNVRALDLTAAVLRRAGRPEDALPIAAGALRIDPLDAFAGNELALAKALAKAPDAGKAAADLAARMRGDAQSHLELACDYAAAGMWDEAIDVLGRVVPAAENATADPMIFYHLGWLWERKGEAEKAARCCRLASRMPWEGCFPSRAESADALRAAMKANPRDARARLYLGNLLYDSQPANAVRAWEAAVAIDPALAPAQRNLGVAFVRQGEKDKAVRAYEAALAADRKDPLLLLELDQALDLAGASPETRLKPLEENRETVLLKDRTIGRLARLYVILGRFDEALDLLTKHHFHLWEGEAGMYGLYVEARLGRGAARLAGGDAAAALKDFEAAREVPPNIEVWSEFAESHPRIHCGLGLAHRALGDASAATAAFEKAAAARGGNAMAYYAARALAELGKKDEAVRVLEGLADAGRKRMAGGEEKGDAGNFHLATERRLRQAEACYIAGLAHLGLDRANEARDALRKALEYNNSHVGAWTSLRALEKKPEGK
jgi:tetratricopeptide (TPR) repeat protein